MQINWSDGELAREIATGAGADAESEFCRRMMPRLRLYGLRHLRHAGAAEDLSQQVLLQAIEALRAGSIREPEKLASYVLGIARMTVLNQRKGVRRKQQLLEEFGAALAGSQPVQCPELDRERLAHCLQALRERERTVIVMTFYDEQTGNELAGLLQVSEANLRVIRHRALRQLRLCMEGGI